MSRIADYLLMSAPSAPFTAYSSAQPGISGRRIALSFLGLFLGVMASFFVSIPQPSGKADGKVEWKSFTWTQAMVAAGSALVVCMLTYQALYKSLNLFRNEPTFLVLFVSFQYGFFWQSMIKGGANIAAAASS